jgi:hypothetical protein
MKVIAVLAAAAAALALAATASAKELKQITACGASGCRTNSDRGTLSTMTDDWMGTIAPLSVTSYYVYRVTVDVGRGETNSWTTRYYPAQHLLRIGRKPEEVTWYTLTPSQRAPWVELARGLEPFAPDGTGTVSSPSDGGFPWTVLAGALAGAAALGAAGVFLVRRRVPAPAPGS